MPRFYFHLQEGTEVLEDEVGVELRDERSARYEAMQLVHAILAREQDKVKRSAFWRLEVADHDHVLFVLDQSGTVWLRD